MLGMIFGIVGVIGFIALLWYVRKAFQTWNEEASSSSAGGFTLGDLRDMRKKGQITEIEFERAKAMIVDAAKRATARAATTKPTGDLSAIIEAEKLKEAHPHVPRNRTGGFPVTDRRDPPTSE